MRQHAGWLALAALLAIAGCDPSTPAPCEASPEPPKQILRIMPLGDSITAGGGSSTGAGYRLPLWDLLTARGEQVDFVGSARSGTFADPDHEGHSGYMVNELRARIDDWIAAAHPDVILLHAGINDVKYGERDGAEDRLLALVDRIHTDKPDAIVYVMGLIPTTGGLEGQTAAFNAVTRDAAASHRFFWVEPPALTADELPDRLHPNDASYQRMANAFSGALVRTSAEESAPPRGCSWTTSS
ncbi:SGNH/GDSL hydrolase family protein [Streptomyces goshikiensis]|uniref:SGNH/GDSL hydrolase family protein n=1 Tax=Streptomyces goshikiensis TaxID=1942 RepID=UPI0034109F60